MGIALELLTEDGEAPALGVTVDGYTTSVLTIRRTTDGGLNWESVAGGVRVDQPGGLYVRDDFPPVNTLVTYEAVVVSGSTPSGVLTASTSIPSPWVWLQDPLSPTNAVRATLVGQEDGEVGVMLGSFSDWDRELPTSRAIVLGRRRPVHGVGVRQAPNNVPLILGLEAKYVERVDALYDLMDSAAVFVIRGLPAVTRLSPVAHVIAQTIREVNVTDDEFGYRRDFEMRVEETTPTSRAVVFGVWTSDEVDALWGDATFDEVEAARPTATALEWEKDPTPP